MRRRQFAAGKVVFREGEIGDTFFQIVEGTAGVYLHYGEEDQRKLNELKAGQYFGELAVIGAWPRSATVVAEEKLRLIEITEFELNAFFEERPERILEIMKQIGDRIRTLTAEYEEVTAFLKEKELGRVPRVQQGVPKRQVKKLPLPLFDTRLSHFPLLFQVLILRYLRGRADLQTQCPLLPPAL